MSLHGERGAEGFQLEHVHGASSKFILMDYCVSRVYNTISVLVAPGVQRARFSCFSPVLQRHCTEVVTRPDWTERFMQRELEKWTK